MMPARGMRAPALVIARRRRLHESPVRPRLITAPAAANLARRIPVYMGSFTKGEITYDPIAIPLNAFVYR
jgi:hypothetical protein